MRRLVAIAAVFAGVLSQAGPAAAACGPCKAEKVTTTTANSLLFGGSDSAGGVGDWYLTNGTIVAIIDNIDTGSIPTVGGSATVDLTSSNTIETGGTLIDLGLKGKQNDQFPQAFNTGGTSLSNAFLFRKGDEVAWGLPNGNNPCATVGSSNSNCPLDPADADCSAITVYGIMLGPCATPTGFCSTRAAPTLRVRTTYKACFKKNALRVRTELWNVSSAATAGVPIFDVFLWGGRGLTPFAAANGHGFSHPALDLSNVVALLSDAPYFAVPGNVDKTDGNMARGKKAGAISYGYMSDGVQDDSNGPTAGGTLSGLNYTLSSLQSPLLTAAAPSAALAAPLPPGKSRIFQRRFIVGGRNDAASVIGDKKNPDSILPNTPSLAGLVGTVSGKLSPGSSMEGTFTFYRTGGTNLSPFGYSQLNVAPISSVRVKGGFSNIQLLEGTYIAQVVVPGRDDVITPSFTVTAGQNTVIPPVVAPKAGKLKIEVRDADLGTGIPAKVSLSPGPRMDRDFAAYTYNVRSGMCSNNFATTCTADATCGGGNTCFRTCTNDIPPTANPGCPGGYTVATDGKCRRHGCNVDADCTGGAVCKADTSDAVPESYGGQQKGGGQMHVIYLDKKGKAQVELKPGTYNLTVSRGPEYTINQVLNVNVTAGATTDAGVVTIKRVVNTNGYLSADFHIHSGRSLDSSAPLEGRVRSFAGEGLEVMVSTDHDINTDYSPIIKKLGMQPFVTSVIGTEVTTSVPKPPYLSNGWGHINSWPSIYDPNQRRGGAIEDEAVSANTIYDRLRAQSDLQCVGGSKNGLACTTNANCGGAPCTDVGEQVVQINHPRAGNGGVVNIGIFDNIGFNPAADITNCQKYPVTCTSSTCNGGTNDGTSCTVDATCTGGGKCSCNAGSIPGAANGCNNILNDLNVVPQATLCTTSGCGGGFEGLNTTRNIDGDVMEIDNAGTTGGFGDLKLVRRDWLSLLNQGVEVGKTTARHPMWGSGVSDSHRLVAEIPGYSRTYVGAGELPVTTPLDVKTFNQEVLDGNMTVTAGPFVTVAANSGGPDVHMGETLGPSVSSVNLKIKVQAPPWIPVDEVRVIQNGCVVACYNSTTTPAVAANPVNPYDQTPSSVVRFDTTGVPLTFPVSGDSYFIVEASPDLPASGDPAVDPIVNSVAESVFPYAFTNPIFADGSGDSEYTGIALSPGTGEPTCPPLPVDCSAGAATTASIAPSVMVAKAEPAAKQSGLLARVLDLFVNRADADGNTPNPVVDDSERVRRREEELRRPNPDHVPWHLIEIPTPAPTPEKK